MLTGELHLAFIIVAAILFLLAAIPPLPYTSSILALGLFFLALSHA